MGILIFFFKGKRFIPTVPTLPNGLRDALQTATTSSESLEPRINGAHNVYL